MYLYRDKLVPRQEASVSPDDRGYYFGDGIYEVLRVYAGVLFEKDAHYRRLLRSAEAVRIALPYPVERLDELLGALLRESGVAEGTVYVQFTRGEAPRAHPFPAGAVSVAFGYATGFDRPLEAMRTGITAVTVPDIRWLRCDLKTLNLLPNVLAKQEALDRGAAESVLHRDGVVTECSASNIMMVRDGRVFTHPANNLILHGVTRAVVLRLARETGIEAVERAFTVDELCGADEAFITGTTAEITPLIAIDSVSVGGGAPGPVTRRLQAAFDAIIPQAE